MFMGVPCVQSKGEAEAMCAMLDAQGVSTVLTMNIDIILNGLEWDTRKYCMN